MTFSEYGERGSVDLLGMHEATGHALIGEVKATIGSLEETNRVLDVKDRLGPKIVRSRYGREPKSVSRVLILAEGRTARRIVDVHIETMESVYPARSRELRAWLRAPSGRISAIWFLSEVADTDLA